jgi:uracil-DNA glycosylase family protein
VREVVLEPTYEAWRAAARRLIAEQVPPEDALWREARPEAPGLFDAPEVPAPPPEPETTELRVPRAFLALAETVAAHKDPDRWRLLYSVLWRIAAGDHDLLFRRDDPDLTRLRKLAAEAEGAPSRDAPGGAAPFVPKTLDLEELRRASASCRGCDLYKDATQTVFGKGLPTARAMLVGEVPGDQEDLQGAPFVGPAGEVLDRALLEAGLPRQDVYVTNVVKHFKFVRTPKRRIHQTPRVLEIAACRPWLEAELAAVRPEILVCLGATASKALIGPEFRLMKERGRFLECAWASKLLATLHPSAVLRAEDAASQAHLYGLLLSDLRLVAGELAHPH